MSNSFKYKIWRYPLLLKLRYFLLSLMSKDCVCLSYWINAEIFLWTPKIKTYNWGDYINMKLAQLISHKHTIPSKYCSKTPQIAMVGSILPWAITKDTIIWGSGCLSSKDIGWKNIEKPLKVCAVRGPLTRDLLLKGGVDCPPIYGDPVLLFPRFYMPKHYMTEKIAIIPHVSSLKQAYDYFDELCRKNDNIFIINPTVFKTWHEFIDKIINCKLVLSSSLHGIIVADAYSVPNIWISFHEYEHPDGNFKFHDYFASVGKQNIQKPIYIKDIDFINIDSYIADYVKPQIDLDKLLDACPINYSKNNK